MDGQQPPKQSQHLWRYWCGVYTIVGSYLFYQYVATLPHGDSWALLPMSAKIAALSLGIILFISVIASVFGACKWTEEANR